MESSAREEEALPKLFLRNELCGDLLDAELLLKTDFDWLLRLAEGMGLAELRRPDGAVNVDSASESLVSVVNCCGTAILDWLTFCLPCHEAGVSDVPASMTAAFNLLGCSMSSLFPFLTDVSSTSCSEVSAEYI